MRGLTDTLLAKPFNPTLTRVTGWWRNEYNRRTASDEPLRTQESTLSNVLPSFTLGNDKYHRVSEDPESNALH